MSFTVIIPARYGSTRFPAKIVASKTGKPLVQHVVERAKLARGVGRVIVATDDQRIAEALAPFGTETWMTSAEHPSGTDRVAEVASKLDCQWIINVQGDEPEIDPGTIEAVMEALKGEGKGGQARDMSTAVTPFPKDQDVANPNMVKAVVGGIDGGLGEGGKKGGCGRALYFSRSVVPYHRDQADAAPAYFLHLGIYGYRREFLLKLATLKPTALERAEKLEQLRVLEHGYDIWAAVVKHSAEGIGGGIDTPGQYEAFVQRHLSAMGQENSLKETDSQGQHLRERTLQPAAGGRRD